MMSEPCQFCMAGSSFGTSKAQLVLYEGSWQAWPLVMSIPYDCPVIVSDICPVCDTERFNNEEIPILNKKIAEYNEKQKEKGK